MEVVLSEMPFKQREILQRYYLREESSEQICLDMSLTETQFRLAKSRAKSALSVRTQIILEQRSAPAVKIPA
jgi:DNA-directed RNA polymerase specialized sigma24 family protein